MTLVIGLTGPIGCGKSTIASWLGESGAVVIDADEVARLVSGPGTPVARAIVARFGSGVTVGDGSDTTIDRAAIARLVFEDQAALRDLESIVRPAVRAAMRAHLATIRRDGRPLAVVEAIGLADGDLAGECDEIWLVDCGLDAQRARLAGRGMGPADAGRRIAAQGGLSARVAAVATRRIDTSGEASETRAVVEAALGDALANAQ